MSNQSLQNLIINLRKDIPKFKEWTDDQIIIWCCQDAYQNQDDINEFFENE